MHRISYLAPNWLALKINNRDISRNLLMMRGVVYDLGCGTRPYEKDILRHADKYVGVDWSNTIHGLNANVVADLNETLPISDASADTVVSFQVLEHLCAPQTMLCEANRILKRGGRIFLSVPFQWWIHEAPHDYFRYTRYGLAHLFERAGFTDVHIQETTGFWTMWLLKLNYQTARLVRGPKIIRWLATALFLPLWLFDQLLAPQLDRLWPARSETAGYFVSALKL